MRDQHVDQGSGGGRQARPMADWVRASNDFTARWVAGHESGDLAVGGSGVWLLLAALSGVASDEVRAELSPVVGLDPDAASIGAEQMLALMQTAPGVSAACAAWHQRTVELLAGVSPVLAPPEAGVLTGNAAVDQTAIDAWVSHATNGTLTGSPVEVTEQTVLAVLSAMAIEVTWVQPFDAYAFPLSSGPWAGERVRTLTQTTTDVGRLTVARTPAGQVTMLRCPTEQSVDVYLLLGEEGTGPGAVLHHGIDAISDGRPPAPDDVTDAPGLTRTTTVSTDRYDRLEIETRAFTVTQSHDLLQNAEQFGLALASDNLQHRFPGLSPLPLFVDSAGHDATAEFSPTGFTATAVTAVHVDEIGSAPERRHEVTQWTLRIDRPFGVLAVERDTGAVMFAAWVEHPDLDTPPSDLDDEIAKMHRAADAAKRPPLRRRLLARTRRHASGETAPGAEPRG